MIEEKSVKEKFELIREFLPQIVEECKKDIKNDHLKSNRKLLVRHMPHSNVKKLASEELCEGYLNALQSDEAEDVEDAGNFLYSRWMLKNPELYEVFERELSKINPDFEQISSLDQEQEKLLLESSISAFGPVKTYIFSILNSVVFSEEALQELRKNAEKSLSEVENERNKAKSANEEKLGVQKLERELLRQKDRFEKKISSLEKRYLKDTEALKKQVALLQSKLSKLEVSA